MPKYDFLLQRQVAHTKKQKRAKTKEGLEERCKLPRHWPDGL